MAAAPTGPFLPDRTLAAGGPGGPAAAETRGPRVRRELVPAPVGRLARSQLHEELRLNFPHFCAKATLLSWPRTTSAGFKGIGAQRGSPVTVVAGARFLLEAAVLAAVSALSARPAGHVSHWEPHSAAGGLRPRRPATCVWRELLGDSGKTDKFNPETVTVCSSRNGLRLEAVEA